MARGYRLICRSICFCIVTLNTLAWGQLADHIVISEVAPGGGSGLIGALYQRDWVELYNPTNSAVSLNGWTLQYKAAATTSGSYSIEFTFGTVSMAPHSFYLIVGGSAGAQGQVLSPVADADAGTTKLVMNASAARLALCNNNTPVSASGEASATNIVDMIGWGAGAAYAEGNSHAPGASYLTTLERRARVGSDAAGLAWGTDAGNGNGYDSNRNGFDFVAQDAPTPQNSAVSPVEVPSSSESQGLGSIPGPSYFILGDGSNSYGVTVNVTSAGTSGATTVTLHSGAASANANELAGKKVIDTYYSIISSAVGTVYTLELPYLQSQYLAISGPLLTESELFLSRRIGANSYQNFNRGAGSSLSSAANGMVQAIGASAFSDWFISADNTSPLPVELTDLSAVRMGSSIFVRWKTAMEVANMGFEVERRPERSHDWTRVGFVEGAGTCSSPKAYAFTDRNTSPGRLYYRIRQIDCDGIAAYSREVDVDAHLAPSALPSLNNYPNPFNPATEIGFVVPEEGRAVLVIYDNLGRRIATLFDGVVKPGQYGTIQFDVSHRASGVYYARLEFGGRSIVRRMLATK